MASAEARPLLMEPSEANDDGIAHLGAAVVPRTSTGLRIDCPRDRGDRGGVSAPRGPAECVGCEWRPTHAQILVGATTYDWNSRQHRKLRFPKKAAATTGTGSAEAAATEEKTEGFRLWCWEPRVVTWHSCWIGIIANTLWVVNGVAATWPDGFEDAGATSYQTGALGAFLFIVTGYLGYVEAVNHTYSQVCLPEEGERRRFAPPHRSYGHWPHPLHLGARGETLSHHVTRALLVERGYPVVEDVNTGRLLTRRACDRVLQQPGAEDAVRGRGLRIRVGDHVVHATVDGLEAADGTGTAAAPGGYRWWTWTPDLHHIEIVNALVFFIATILFFIPACAWLPMGNKGASLPATVFWVYVLQIVPSVGFVYVGHASMAEAAGSWCKPSNTIGWWASFFNWIGGYGFLLCAILALPGLYGDPGCCDALDKWGSALSTFWGSCAFWVAGILEWIEFANPHPITVFDRKAKS